MLIVTLITMVALARVSAEQVACRTGVNTCRGASGKTVIQNEHYCCDNGFSMQWVTQTVNGTSAMNCFCDRQVQESDCLQGQSQCMRATSSSSDGNTVRCCLNGDSMRSISNAVVNGVVVNSCKCLRHTTSQGLVISNNGQVRPMTEGQRGNLNQWQRNFGSQMNHFQQNLANLGRRVGFPWGSQQANRPSFSDRASNFLQNLQNEVRQVSGNPGLPVRTNGRGLIQNLRGLTQSLGNAYGSGGRPAESGTNQNPNAPFSQSYWTSGIFDPAFWLGPNWRTVFGSNDNSTGTTNASGQPAPNAVNPYSQGNSVANPAGTANP